ncbi:unnamed protein product [Acanthosepion pharaonis]|uniref:Uncharacterized protein n=1 Tax=Acanthosepion pharaonis TaxID=158019 RepID=A0A812CAB3_ACAPH|nr:unnamed protein product [Sepia pharaonis]
MLLFAAGFPPILYMHPVDSFQLVSLSMSLQWPPIFLLELTAFFSSQTCFCTQQQQLAEKAAVSQKQGQNADTQKQQEQAATKQLQDVPDKEGEKQQQERVAVKQHQQKSDGPSKGAAKQKQLKQQQQLQQQREKRQKLRDQQHEQQRLQAQQELERQKQQLAEKVVQPEQVDVLDLGMEVKQVPPPRPSSLKRGMCEDEEEEEDFINNTKKEMRAGRSKAEKVLSAPA